MITYKQLTLAEIFEDCQNKFDNDKYQFLSLLDEAINLDEIVPVSFISHFYHLALATLLGETAKYDQVAQGIEQEGIAFHPVPSGTADLLVVVLDTPRHAVMHDPADIALVDTHPESYRGVTGGAVSTCLRPTGLSRRVYKAQMSCPRVVWLVSSLSFL